MKDNQIVYSLKIKTPKIIKQVKLSGKKIPVTDYERVTSDMVIRHEEGFCLFNGGKKYICDIVWFNGEPYIERSL